MDAEKPAKRCENCRLPLPDLAGLRHHEPWKCTELLRAALDLAERAHGGPRKLTREQARHCYASRFETFIERLRECGIEVEKTDWQS